MILLFEYICKLYVNLHGMSYKCVNEENSVIKLYEKKHK